MNKESTHTNFGWGYARLVVLHGHLGVAKKDHVKVESFPVEIAGVKGRSRMPQKAPSAIACGKRLTQPESGKGGRL